jgi:hypothetical protein
MVGKLKRFSQLLESRAAEFGIVKANDLRRKVVVRDLIGGRSVERTMDKHGKGFAGVRFKSEAEGFDPL